MSNLKKLNLNKLKPPVLVLNNEYDGISTTKKIRDLSYVSKGGENYYKNAILIDADGNLYQILKAKIIDTAKWYYWLRYFSKVYRVTIFYKNNKKIILEELKKMLKEKIKQNEEKWLYWRGQLPEEIYEAIDKASTFEELINLFY